MKLYLLSHANYFNRKIIPLVTGELDNALYTIDPVNFNEGDGITASVIVNTDEIGNYVVIENGDIYSHWFVTDNVFIRKKQQRLSLKRDVILDNWSDVVNAPCHINRAMLNNADNDFIFNSEGYSFNQIKVDETLLYDWSYSPWIVIYVDKNVAYPIKIDLPSSSDNVITLSGSLESWEYNKYIVNPMQYNGGDSFTYRHKIQVQMGEQSSARTLDISSVDASYSVSIAFIPRTMGFSSPLAYQQISDTYKEDLSNINNIAITYLKNQISTFENDSTNLSNFLSYNGKVIYFSGENKYYYISITQLRKNTQTFEGSLSDPIYNKMFSIAKSAPSYLGGDPDSADLQLIIDTEQYQLSASEYIPEESSSIEITSSHASTDDSNYDIYFLPYRDNLRVRTYASNGFNIQSSRQMMIAQRLIKQLSTTHCYDAQILPYCPNQDIVGNFNVSVANISKDEYVISEDNSSIIFFAKKAESSFDILLHKLSNSYDESTSNQALALKKLDSFDMYRIVSPNYASSFEFSLAKNGGKVDSWHVNMTLKPTNPFIHVSPQFDRLYGEYWNDAKGLTLSGDFSLPMASDSWLEYQSQNKNYELIFNRQIENLDVNYAIQSNEASFAMTAGVVGSAVSGAISGAKLGGSIGAVAGGLTSGVSSLTGGILDYSNLKKRQTEARDMMFDMRNYQLGNVKALGYSLTKIGCLNKIFKYYPFVERYTCTDVEKDMFDEYLTYKSMNVNALGRIIDYLHEDFEFIQGDIIRLPDDMENHMASEIRNEIALGVYLKGA